MSNKIFKWKKDSNFVYVDESAKDHGSFVSLMYKHSETGELKPRIRAKFNGQIKTLATDDKGKPKFTDYGAKMPAVRCTVDVLMDDGSVHPSSTLFNKAYVDAVLASNPDAFTKGNDLVLLGELVESKKTGGYIWSFQGSLPAGIKEEAITVSEGTTKAIEEFMREFTAKQAD